MLELTDISTCIVALQFGVTLLDDLLISTSAQYLLLQEESYYQYVNTEDNKWKGWHSLGLQVLSECDDARMKPPHAVEYIHRTLARMPERMVILGLAGSTQGALEMVEFKALRQLLRTLRGAAIQCYNVEFPLDPRPFMECLVLRPITELVKEVDRSRPHECRTRKHV